MTTVHEAYEAHSGNMLTFLKKYQPDEPGTLGYSQWVEDVRRLSVGAEASFYTLVLEGDLRDGGYPFLRTAANTFDDFTIAEGPERPKVPNHLQEMEYLFKEPHDADVHIAGALRALAWQTERIIAELGNIQDRLLDANNL